MDIELRPLNGIRPYETNPRINDQAVDAVARSLEEFGFRQPIVVDEDELAAYLDPGVQESLTDPDDVPEPPDEAVTKPGDLWVLGDHRLLCGDAGSEEDVDRLLDEAAIHLCNCDPPYNVRVEPRSNNAISAGLSSFQATEAKRKGKLKHHQGLDLARHPTKSKATHKKLRAKDRPLTNDFVSDEEFNRLLHAWFGNIARVLLPGRAFYIWGGMRIAATIRRGSVTV